MSELLACPFCGGEAELQRWHTKPYVSCTQCGCSMPDTHQTEEQAIEAWNTRHERMCHVVKVTRTLRSMLHGEQEVTDEKCSECGGYMDVGFGVIRNYCPRCGCKVVGE